jgi:hypothetical protein
MKLPILLALGALALAPAGRAADLSGLWIVSSNLAQTPTPIDCTILQVGVTLSGWCEPESATGAPAALAGSLSQNTASWSSDLTLQGQPLHLAYQATVSADQRMMSGQLTYGTLSAGLTATRK